MKLRHFIGRLLLAAAVVLVMAAPALAETYQCVRPDKTVVCTINTTSSDPSVVCNHDCKSCNLVCAAVKKILTRETTDYRGPDMPSMKIEAGPDPKKTAREVIEKTIQE